MVEEGDPYDQADVQRRAALDKDRITETEAQTLQYLRVRQEAYRRMFSGEAQDGDAEIVMRDIKAFCRGDTSTYHDSERVHVLLTGRQEVYMRIMDHMRLTYDDLVTKYTQPR